MDPLLDALGILLSSENAPLLDGSIIWTHSWDAADLKKNAPRLDESDILVKKEHGASTGAIFLRPWAALGGLSYTFRFHLLGPPLRRGKIVELHGQNFGAAI